MYFEMFDPDERPAQEVMIDKLRECQIYIGLFGEKFREATIEKEFSEAKNIRIPTIIYLKEVLRREEQLDEFINQLRSKEGLVYRKFESVREFAELVRRNIKELYDSFFENNQG